jgi:ABC-2 type transport system permease protein
VLSVVVCAIFIYAGMPSTLNYFAGFWPGMVPVMENMSMMTHFESLQKGVIKFSDIMYFIILIAGWIYACGIILDERKAK